jgi:hypothetical protein
MITVAPLKPEEQRTCAYCGGPMHSTDRKMLFGAGTSQNTEEMVDSFETNRRVIALRKRWHDVRDYSTDEVVGRRLSYAEVTFYPEKESQWGYDGTFCKLKCGWRFARAAHRAGYRIKETT